MAIKTSIQSHLSLSSSSSLFNPSLSLSSSTKRFSGSAIISVRFDMEIKDVGGEDRNAKMVRLVPGDELPEPDILRALSQCGNNPDAAINFILDTPGLFPAMTVKRTVTSTGARISPPIKQEKGAEVESAEGSKPIARVKEEPVLGFEKKSLDWVQKSEPKMSFDEFPQATNTEVMADDLFMTQIKEENTDNSDEAESLSRLKADVKVKEEFDLGTEKKVAVKEEVGDSESFEDYLRLTEKPKEWKAEIRVNDQLIIWVLMSIAGPGWDPVVRTYKNPLM